MGKKKHRPGPKRNRLSKESEQRIESLASKYGIRAPRPGDDLDRKFNTSSSFDTDAAEPLTAYQRLVRIFGVEALDAVEGVVVVALGIILVVFLTSGIAISSEAFFKASGKEIPDYIEATLLNLEKAFTPTVLVFLGLSSMFGLYKQSQLSSGATSYSTLNKDEE